MKRLFVLGILLWAPQVWAQCQPTNSPTLDFSTSATVAPNQMPFAAVTLNVSAVDGSQTSHKLTAGANTALLLHYQGYNTASLALYYSVDGGGSQLFWIQPSGMSGQIQFQTNPSWSGYTHTMNLYLIGQERPGSGSFTSTTQDVVQISVTNQNPAPGIYKSDNITSNGYLMVSLNYSGTPNIPYQTTCPNATEKDMVPTAQLNLANVTSGENRNGVSFQGATTVVGQPVQATAYDYISFIPGDVIATNAGGFVYCSAIGDFWQVWDSVSVEWAWTKAQTIHSTCHPLTGGGTRCNLTPFCSPASTPPDWIPHEITTNQFGVADMPSFWLGGSVGFSIEGSPYIFPGSIIAGILPGAVNWATFLAPGIPSTSTPIDCTNTPNNIHPIIPWPF